MIDILQVIAVILLALWLLGLIFRLIVRPVLWILSPSFDFLPGSHSDVYYRSGSLQRSELRTNHCRQMTVKGGR